MVLHQNRSSKDGVDKSSTKNYKHMPEDLIPNFIDLVIWGHEHESIQKIQKTKNSNFSIYQPGSTVITSLIRSESKEKHIGLIEIELKTIKLTPIKLKTVRPLFYDEVFG